MISQRRSILAIQACIGLYLPSEHVLAEGGYERGLMRITGTLGFHPGPWAQGVEARVVGEVHRLLRDIDRP